MEGCLRHYLSGLIFTLHIFWKVGDQKFEGIYIYDLDQHDVFG